MIVYLAELRPGAVGDGTEQVIRLSSSPAWTRADAEDWLPRLTQPLRRSVQVFDGQFKDQPQEADSLEFVLMKGDSPLPLTGMVWDGRPVKVWKGEAGQGTAQMDLIFDGTSLSVQGNKRRVQVNLRGPHLARPLLDQFYAGTGLAEGPSEIKNTPKPLLMGTSMNLEPIYVNRAKGIFQYHAYGNLAGYAGPGPSVLAVYDSGSQLGATIGDYATYAALEAAVVPAGRFATCNALGMGRHGGEITGILTIDARGAVSGGLPGDIVRYLVETRASLPASKYVGADLAWLSTQVPHPQDLYVQDQVTLEDQLRAFMLSLGGYLWFTDAGKLTVGLVRRGGVPSVLLDRLNIAEGSRFLSTSAPFWQRRQGYQRSWRKHSYGEVRTPARLNPRGTWQTSEVYQYYDLVEYGSRSWVYTATVAGNGAEPGSDPNVWTLFSTNGAPVVDSATAPVDPVQGTLWRNSTTGMFSWWNNGAWVQVADITGVNISAGITGQGALATVSEVDTQHIADEAVGSDQAAPGSFHLGFHITRADGLTILTDALAVTSLGTAAAIAGQGAFATVNTAGYGSSLLTGFGALAPLGNVYFGSPYLLEGSGGAQATLNAFRTNLGTAAAIAGQGVLATLGQVLTQHIGSRAVGAAQIGDVETGPNLLLNPLLNDTVYWANYANRWTLVSNPSNAFGTPHYIIAEGNGTTTQGAAIFETPSAGMIRVEGGKSYRVFSRGWADDGFTGVLFVMIRWFKGDGTAASSVSTNVLGPDHRGAGNAKVGTGLEDVNGVVTAPSDAEFAVFSMRLSWPTAQNSAGKGAMSSPRFVRLVDSAAAAQNAFQLGYHITRADGVTSLTDALAVTSLGTAAAIAGQGAFATVNTVGYGSPLLTGFGALAPLGNVYFGSPYLLEGSGGAQATLNAFRTNLGTAAAIAGQGAFATVNTVGYGSPLLTGFGALAPLGNVYFGSSFLLESNGGIQATRANFRTDQGVAAGIAGQGSGATANDLWGLSQDDWRRTRSTATDLLYEAFGYGSWQISRSWLTLGGTNGEITTLAGSTAPSGRFLSLGDNTGNDSVRMRWIGEPVPFDPDELYEVLYVVRQMSSSSGLASTYLGVVGVASDKIALVNTDGLDSYASPSWCCAEATRIPEGPGWRVYRGYVKGKKNSGVSGDGGVFSDPSNPAKMHEATSYIVPTFAVNWTSEPGRFDISLVRIRRVQVQDIATALVDSTNNFNQVSRDSVLTSLGTSAGFTGQGYWATRAKTTISYADSDVTGWGTLANRNDVYFGNAMMRETSGGATATLANFKTSSGTAAGISGQGALATLSSVSLEDDARVTNKGRISKLSTSGRVSDPTAYNTQALLGPRNTTTIAPTYTVGASNVTVNIPSHVRRVAGTNGPVALSYGAGSGVVAFDTNWWCYVDDAALAGIASPTYTFTTTANDLLYAGRYHVASGRTPTSGGSGGSTGGGGGGSGSGWDPEKQIP